MTARTERLGITDVWKPLKGRIAPGGVGEGHNESESETRHSHTVDNLAHPFSSFIT
jgi:hypothetical protein